MKRVQKILCLAFSVIMLLGMSTTAFASEKSTTDENILSKEGVTAEINLDENQIAPRWAAGDGPAP